jgi:hypothetical protein
LFQRLLRGALTDLGAGTTATSKFLSGDLTGSATATKSGYSVNMAGVGTAVTGTTACVTVSGLYPAFNAYATPVTAGSTGVRYFGTTEGGTVYQHSASFTFAASTRAASAGTPIQ